MEGQTNRKIRVRALQRELRNAPTDAEAHLWRFLRGRNIAGAKFRRQHPFERYILDFACLDPKIVVELDGGHHAESGRYDASRTALLADAGFVVLRFWNHDVFERTQAVLDAIWAAVTSSRTHPHPGPPLEGEGDEQSP